MTKPKAPVVTPEVITPEVTQVVTPPATIVEEGSAPQVPVQAEGKVTEVDASTQRVDY